MKKYKHILVALDLSEHCNKLLQEAQHIMKSDLSADEKTELSVVHVVEHSAAAYGGEFSVPVDVNLEQQIEAAVRANCQKIASKYDIPQERMFLATGSVKQEVVEVAKKIHADLIIIGLRSHSGLERLLGSRASGILDAAPCQVLAVPL